MSDLVISGFGQHPSSLLPLAPHAQMLDYLAYPSIEEAAQHVASNPERVIGWSLGGQVAIDLIERGIIKPNHVVLLATPFQFLADEQIHAGMDSDRFHDFKQGIATNLQKTLTRFTKLIALNDQHEKDIARQLEQTIHISEHLAYWLGYLEQFSGFHHHISKLPHSLVIHGRDDDVVDVSQAGLFTPFLTSSRTLLLDHCAHAPHLHDTERVKTWIEAQCQ